jgi:hypothetical protein
MRRCAQGKRLPPGGPLALPEVNERVSHGAPCFFVQDGRPSVITTTAAATTGSRCGAPLPVGCLTPSSAPSPDGSSSRVLRRRGFSPVGSAFTSMGWARTPSTGTKLPPSSKMRIALRRRKHSSRDSTAREQHRRRPRPGRTQDSRYNHTTPHSVYPAANFNVAGVATLPRATHNGHVGVTADKADASHVHQARPPRPGPDRPAGPRRLHPGREARYRPSRSPPGAASGMLPAAA